MTQSELKELTNLGAELGAAKAENERLRGLLREAFDSLCDGLEDGPQEAQWSLRDRALAFRIKDALSNQAEPTDTYTAVDMATAAAQGFRDGQAAVEQAAAQDDGRSAFQAYLNECAAYDFVPSIAGAFHFAWQASPEQPIRMPPSPYTPDVEPESMTDYERGEAQGRCDMWAMVKELNAARPAQTEQQPVGWINEDELPENYPYDAMFPFSRVDVVRMFPVYTPIAQTAPQGKFRMGDLVKKSTGSEWEGRVVGWYSTEQTKEGYAVESSAHRNSVQIHPAKALEAVDG